MNIVGRERPQEEAEIKARDMTSKQNMLIISQQDIINLSRRAELPLQVVILTALWDTTQERDPHVFSRRLATSGFGLQRLNSSM